MRLFPQTRSFALLIVCAFLFAARPASADVLKVSLDDTINPVTAEYIDRAIDEAQRSHADAVLIVLDTPGGTLGSMEKIIQKTLASPVPVIVYVTPAGADAGSAGFFILEAADIAAMAPGTHAGAAHPVSGDGRALDPIMKEKLENYASSLLRSYVGKRGRNVEVAESAMKESKAFTAEESLEKNLINIVARDSADLFAQLDGKPITRFDGSKTVLHLAGKPMRSFDMTVRQHVLGFLMDPNVLFLLFTIGLLSIYFEFNHPGAVAPGVLGFIAILLFFYALNLLPFRSVSLVLILLGFALFVLEAKFPSHGAYGIGGIVLLTLGGLLLVDGPIPEMRVNLWTALGVSIPFGAITVFLMSIALKARRNKVVTGEQGMIGEIGVVTSPLTPAGKVFVQGELWDAVSPVNADSGSKVVVRRVENLVLHVEPVREAVQQSVVVG
ncbi:MAG TPA: nodulation protein NfeD [Candidatus Angelobacter sp.]|nr:nodulation protein NfeD [Candidatus Angelobacter sp.]